MTPSRAFRSGPPTVLEELADPYPFLREAWQRGGPGDKLTVRYGAGRYHYRTPHVRALLRLAGFAPVRPRRLGPSLEMEAAWAPRESRALSCSIIVPCRDEVGNVDGVVERVPDLGTHTELIFVDGGSTDGTPAAIDRAIGAHPDRDIRLLHQPGTGGKAEAVFMGFDAAQGDVLLILDADMTVAPEDLPRFFDALADGVARFANGTRFVYPMHDRAMRGANNLGNQAFSLVLSWLLETRVTDTLCGTKALLREDWTEIRRARALFGHHDRWGDFDLLLGAARAGLTIADVPVRYGARTAGESKMRPLRDGLALARTSLAGIRQLKLSRGRPGSPVL